MADNYDNIFQDMVNRKAASTLSPNGEPVAYDGTNAPATNSLIAQHGQAAQRNVPTYQTMGQAERGWTDMQVNDFFDDDGKLRPEFANQAVVSWGDSEQTTKYMGQQGWYQQRMQPQAWQRVELARQRLADAQDKVAEEAEELAPAERFGDEEIEWANENGKLVAKNQKKANPNQLVIDAQAELEDAKDNYRKVMALDTYFSASHPALLEFAKNIDPKSSDMDQLTQVFKNILNTDNGLTVSALIAGQSFVAQAPETLKMAGASLVGGPVVGGVIRAGMGYDFSHKNEWFHGVVMDVLKENKVDVTDADAVKAALADPKLRDQITAQERRAMVVAGFDALSSAADAIRLSPGNAWRILREARRLQKDAGEKGLMAFGDAVSDVAKAGVQGKSVVGRTAMKLEEIATQTAVQGALGGMGEYFGQTAAGQEHNMVDVAMEIIGEFGPGAFEAMTTVSVGAARDKRATVASERAKQEQTALSNLVRASLGAQTALQDSERVSEWIERVGGDSVVFIDGKVALDQGLIEELRGVDPVMANRLQAGAENGESVSIPVTSLAQLVTDQNNEKLAEKIIYDSRTIQDGMSPREADEFARNGRQEAVDRFEREIERAKPDITISKLANKIAHDLGNQLVEAGMPRDYANAVAKPWEAYLVNRAKQLGISPEEIARRLNIRVQRKGGVAAITRGSTEGGVIANADTSAPAGANPVTIGDYRAPVHRVMRGRLPLTVDKQGVSPDGTVNDGQRGFGQENVAEVKIGSEPDSLGQGRVIKIKSDEYDNPDWFVLKRTLDNMSVTDRAVFDEYVASRPDAERIMSNLERLKDTPWAKQAIEGVFVRAAMIDLMNGREPRAQSMLDHPQMKLTRRLLSRGEDGLWTYFVEKGFVGNASKPANNVNSSFINCDPSNDCAKFCYATKGNYKYAATVVKSELVSEAIRINPARAAEMTARSYKATLEFENGKALRLFDKGDGDETWIPYIKELNEQGIRVQIFSKRPEFLRMVPEMNLRLLSIDESNKAMAEENPDLDIAFVYSSESQIVDIIELNNSGRLQVVLPVKLSNSKKALEVRKNLVKALRLADKSVSAHICPIDAGWKAIKDEKHPDGWNCTMCDKNGGCGCFFGKATKAVMDAASKADADVNAIEGEDLHELVLKLKELKKEYDNEAGIGGSSESSADGNRAELGAVDGSGRGSRTRDVSARMDDLLETLLARVDARAKREMSGGAGGKTHGVHESDEARRAEVGDPGTGGSFGQSGVRDSGVAGGDAFGQSARDANRELLNGWRDDDTPSMAAVREQYEGTDNWMKAPNGQPTNLTEKQWLKVRTPEFKKHFGDWEKLAERQEYVKNIRSFTSKLDQARGKTRKEIKAEFGNEMLPIARIPHECLDKIDTNIKDNRVYSAEWYFLDHAVNHHPEITAEKYDRVPEVFDSPDAVYKSIAKDGKPEYLFVKNVGQHGRAFVRVESCEDGRLVIHRSYFITSGKPNVDGMELIYGELVGGQTTIIRDEGSPHGGDLSVLNRPHDDYTTKSTEIEWSYLDENGEPLSAFVDSVQNGYFEQQKNAGGNFSRDDDNVFAQSDVGLWSPANTVYRGSNSNTTPYNEGAGGFAMWAAGDPDRITSYAGAVDVEEAVELGTLWRMDTSKIPHISSFYERIRQAFDDREGEFTSNIYDTYSDADDLIDILDPDDIVDSAGAWDDPDTVGWIWEHIFDPEDVLAVELSDGAISFEGYDGPVEHVSATTLDKLTLDQRASQDRRGQYTPSNVENPDYRRSGLIELMEKADKSTFLHESAHAWLDADTALAKDLGRILASGQKLTKGEIAFLRGLGGFFRWGVSEGVLRADFNVALDDPESIIAAAEAWSQMSIAEQRGMHELFAEGFESYLMKGTAPNAEMIDIFQRFASWLKDVYLSVTKQPHPISPDVARLYDLLFVSDQEAKEAEDRANAAPLFQPEPVDTDGMSADEKSAYQKMVERAKAATEEAIRKAVAKAVKITARLAPDEATQVARTQKERIDAEIKKLEETPRHKARKLIKSGNRDFYGDMKLDPQALLDAGFSEETVKVLQRKNLCAERGGRTPEQIANLVGADNPQRLIEELVDIKDPHQEALENVAADIRDEMGIDPSAYSEVLADLAAHNDERSKLLTAEYNAICRKLGRKQFVHATAREWALQKINSMKVGDVYAKAYIRDEAKNARLAEEAFRNGDLAGCLEFKRAQIAAHHMAKAALELQAAREKATRLAGKASRSEAVDGTFRQAIQVILQNHFLGNMTAKERAEYSKLDPMKLSDEFIKELQDAGTPIEGIEKLMSDRSHIKDMTVADARTLFEVLGMLNSMGRTRIKQALIDESKTVNEVVKAGKARLQNSPDMPMQVTGLIQDQPRTKMEKATDKLRQFFISHISMQAFCRTLDGNKDGGWWWKLFIRSANRRANFENAHRADVAEKLDKIFKPVFKKNQFEDKRMIDGFDKPFDHGQRLVIALNLGNESNRQRLVGGDPRWTPEAIKQVLDTLTEADWRAVEAVWKLFESYRPLIAAKEKRVNGVEPQWIEFKPFEVVTAEGKTITVSGGYYPVKYNPRASNRAQQYEDASSTMAELQSNYQSSTTRRSFVKSRQEAVMGMPLSTEFTGLYDGLNDIIHDLAWHEWLIETKKVLDGVKGSGGLREEIRQRYGTQYAKMLEDWRKDIAQGGRTPSDSDIGSICTPVAKYVGLMTMGWSLMSGAVQLLGAGYAVPRAGAGNVMIATRKWLTSPMSLRKEINDKSAMMALRARTMNRDIADIRNKLESSDSFIRDNAFSIIQLTQGISDTITWQACYESAIKQGMSESDAIDVADQGVIDTQSGGNVHDQSAIMRDKGIFRIFTTFYSWANAAINMSVYTKFGEKSRAKKLAALMFMGIIMPIIEKNFREALTAEGDDGDDDDPLMKQARKMGGAVAEYHLGLFVGARELSSAVGNAISGEPAFSYSGPAGLRSFQTAANIADVVKSPTDRKAMNILLDLIGCATGYPSGQVKKTIKGIMAIEQGRVEGVDALLAPTFGYSGKLDKQEKWW